MILGTICARGGSKGVPNKATRLMLGHSLLWYTFQHAIIEKDVLDSIVISSDSKDILKEAEGLAKSFSKRNIIIDERPDYLAKDDTSKWDVFRYLSGKYPCDIMVDLDIGCPLRVPADIRNSVRKLKEGGDVVVTAYESERNPYFNMVLESGSIVCQSKVITRRQDAPKVFSLSPSVFAIRQGVLWKVDHWSQADLRIYQIPRERGIDIDTMDDWNYVEFLMRREP